jgi:hypothetical protein
LTVLRGKIASVAFVALPRESRSMSRVAFVTFDAPAEQECRFRKACFQQVLAPPGERGVACPAEPATVRPVAQAIGAGAVHSGRRSGGADIAGLFERGEKERLALESPAVVAGAPRVGRIAHRRG